MNASHGDTKPHIPLLIHPTQPVLSSSRPRGPVTRFILVLRQRAVSIDFLCLACCYFAGSL